MQFCLSPNLGGLELYFYRLSKYLNSKTKITMIVNKKSDIINKLRNANIEYYDFERKSTFSVLCNAKKIAKIIDKNKIDLIHVHWTKDIPLAVLSRLLSKRKPKLVQTRHMAMTRFKNDFYHKFLYKNIDTIIAVTNEVKDQVYKYISSEFRPKIIRSYIGAEKIRKIDLKKHGELSKKYTIEDYFTIGIFGRIEKEKGQYLLIEAIKKLKKNKLKIKVLIVGHAMSEKYLNELKEDVKKFKLQDNILFTGFTNEVQNIMQICDLVVLTTNKETFGLVLIEAMQAGIAVLASNKGGPTEIIENNIDGLLFKSMDIDDLTDKINYLSCNKEERNLLANEGRKKAEIKFNDIVQFDEVVKILEKI